MDSTSKNISNSSGNELSPTQQEDDFIVICIVISPDRERTCLRLQHA